MFSRELSNINMLVYEPEPFEKIDEFTRSMLRENEIEGVIPTGMENSNILIPISNLVPLREYLEMFEEDYNLLNAGFFTKQYERIIGRTDSFMIPRGEVILNFAFAFINPEVGALVLPVVPTSHSHFESHSLFEFESCIVNVIKEMAGRARPEGEEEIQKPKVKKEKTKKEKKEKKEKPEKKSREKGQTFKKLKESLFSGKGDDIFDFEREAVLPEGIFVIAVRSTGAEYPLMFGPDIIGSDESRCSIAFPGDGEMEAEHASITLARGKYYLADLNSRSGTLLNGQPVEPGRTYELSSADLITIAGEELVFSRRSQ